MIRLLFPGESLGVRQMSSLLSEDGFTLSPGYISKTVPSLLEDRYAQRGGSGKIRLSSQDLLLHDWASAYSFKARRRSIEGWYYAESECGKFREAYRACLCKMSV